MLNNEGDRMNLTEVVGVLGVVNGYLLTWGPTIGLSDHWTTIPIGLIAFIAGGLLMLKGEENREVKK